jgi:hypothetical protein
MAVPTVTAQLVAARRHPGCQAPHGLEKRGEGDHVYDHIVYGRGFFLL